MGALDLAFNDGELAEEYSLAYGLSGRPQAEASREAGRMQFEASQRALDFQRESRDLFREDLAPFVRRGNRAGNLLMQELDPRAQYDYLQQNPLFQAALDRADRQSNNTFLAQGRLGDAREQLSNNLLQTAQPLLSQRRNTLQNVTQLGQSSAAGQASGTLSSGNQISDLITQGGNALASGQVGAANAMGQGSQNLATAAGSILGAIFSDRRLKENVERVGETEGGTPIYTYRYKGDNKTHMGVMADEVKKKNPEAVYRHPLGFDMVNYSEVS